MDNGQIAMLNTTTFGSMVTYECSENCFFDDGTKPSRTCLSSGEWSNEDIQCSNIISSLRIAFTPVVVCGCFLGFLETAQNSQ